MTAVDNDVYAQGFVSLADPYFSSSWSLDSGNDGPSGGFHKARRRVRFWHSQTPAPKLTTKLAEDVAPSPIT
jgi:hypothetical protein